jgi:hypothetical protein
VEYLGHIFNKDCVRVDPKKIEAMQDWPHPKTCNILHVFMGLMGYYHKFVHNYGKIGTPLTTLLKNNDFNWNPTTDQSFHALKESVFTTLVLTLLDFTKTLS